MNRSLHRLAAAVAAITLASTIQAQAAPAPQPAAAQPTPQQVTAAIDTLRTEIASARKQTVAQNMTLTDQEATGFWPVYDAYRADMKKAKDAEWAVIQAYAQNYGMMSDSVAQRLIGQWMDSRKRQQELRAAYVPKFAAVIPWTKVARYFQIENKLDVMLDFARSRQIPLVK
jgi:hypothetical protein